MGLLRNNRGSGALVMAFTLMALPLLFALFAGETMAKERDVVLIGASVGKAWNFPELTQRLNLDGFRTEYIGVFDTFDKSSAVKAILDRKDKPDAVIIKECSIFFPGNLNEYKRQMTSWVAMLRQHNVTPVLTTVVPFAEPDTMTYKAKQIVKAILGKPNRLEKIVQYNEWVREYSRAEKIQLLDFEIALRISESNRHLDPRYDIGDRVHLNPLAYKVLDKTIEPLLRGL